jgi:hypothetical protein
LGSMKFHVALSIWLLVAVSCVFGIVGLTSWGCFQKHQFAWWVLGVSSTAATCIILTIAFSFLALPLQIRLGLFLVTSLFVSTAIIGGVYFSASLPRIGPSRRADLLQLASLFPLLIVSLSFTPCLLRIYRGIRITNVSFPIDANRLVEFFSFVLLFVLAFVIPIFTVPFIGHSSSDSAFFILFSIACIATGSVVWTAVAIFMRFGWMVQLLFTATFLLIGWIAAASSLATFASLSARGMVVTATAATSGPFLVAMFLFSLRLLGYRLLIPPRAIAPAQTPDTVVHPLDAV